MIRAQAENKIKKDHDVTYEDDETRAKVELPKVKLATGEEGFVCLLKTKCKLFRVRDKEWKERGIGYIKL